MRPGRWPASRRFTQSTLDALSAHLAVLDDTGSIVAVNDAWRRFAVANGSPHPNFHIGDDYLAACDAAGPDAAYAREAARGIREVAAGRRASFELEYPCHSPDEERWFCLRVTRFHAGGRVWVVTAHENITARKRAEDQQRVLLDELNHRVRNNLTIVQSMALQTLRRSSSVEEFEQAFLKRLDALSEASTLMAAHQWRAAELRPLVEVALKPYRTGGRRMGLRGGGVTLPAGAALTLSMVLHELATNAAKYGALSVPEGRVDVVWRVGRVPGQEPRLSLRWTERGGPPVAEPGRRGFGRTLIERSLAYELDGTAEFEFRPAGLRCRVELPLAGAPRA